MKHILVAGGSGLVGGYLVADLLRQGHKVRAVGRSPLEKWRQVHKGAENISLDLSIKDNCKEVMKDIDSVYNLAAEIGGVSFIQGQKAQTMLSVLINTHLLLALRDSKASEYFYASTFAAAISEMVEKDKSLNEVIEDGHIWEKLFSEKLSKYFREDFGLKTFIGRLQNIYGPFDVYDGGRERAPAALCRKAAIAKHTGNHELEIWGDGKQVRSFMFAPDVAEGIQELVKSGITDPVRLGSPEFVTINDIVGFVEEAAGITFKRKYKLDAPVGMTRAHPPVNAAEKKFSWQPKTPLREGIKRLYLWIESDMKKKGKI